MGALAGLLLSAALAVGPSPCCAQSLLGGAFESLQSAVSSAAQFGLASVASLSGGDMDVDSAIKFLSPYFFLPEGAPAGEPWYRPFDPLLDLDPIGLVQHWGYPGERHWATTDDGYVLGLHRIPGPRRPQQGSLNPQEPSKVQAGEQGSAQQSAQGGLQQQQGGAGRAQLRPVVMLGHPLLSSSAEWLVKGPGEALALLLADRGFDVWLFNVRGNTYSRNHTTLSVRDEAFWDFTFHEHGTLDLPAAVRYVVRATGQQSLHYVGLSMGCTAMLVMASERPDAASHVSLFTALAPATSLGRSRSALFRALAKASPSLLASAEALGVRHLLSSSAAIKAAGETLCADASPAQGVCTGLIASLSGRNDAQMNATMLPSIIARTPSGTSLKNMDHFSQLLQQGAFQQYDYGAAENLRRYGSESPPRYNMSRVHVPTRVHYGRNDHLADYKDVEALCAELPVLLSCEAAADPLWTHLDFVWAKDARSVVYDKVVAAMEQRRPIP